MKTTIWLLTEKQDVWVETRYASEKVYCDCPSLTLPRLAPSHMEKLAEHGSPKSGATQRPSIGTSYGVLFISW